MDFSFSDKISPHFSMVLGRLGAAAAEDAAVSGVFSSLNRQCTPSAAENNVQACELDDPLGEAAFAVTDRLVRQYKNRCLLKVTDTCFSNCRFCVYRPAPSVVAASQEKSDVQTESTSQPSPLPAAARIKEAELTEACTFLSEHGEINEIIISGGDPFTMGDDKLAFIFEAVRKARPGILIRLCTRAPVFAPERFSRETLAMLRKYRPLWLISQVNHPAELSARWAPEAQKCLLSLVDAGIPVQTDTVLLRGVNDSLPVLAELFTLLVHLGVKPGNLQQLALVKGASHFRVPLSEGLKLYNQLKKELSDLALPSYVINLPGGGGLVNIPATRFAREGEFWKYTDAAGNSWSYPV